MAVDDRYALIVGDAPLDSSFWRSKTGHLFLVRIWCCEEDFDVDRVMSQMRPSVFDKPKEILTCEIIAPHHVMFDSAEPGDDPDKKFVSISIKPGNYRILTQTYEPDAETSLVLHRFDLLP